MMENPAFRNTNKNQPLTFIDLLEFISKPVWVRFDSKHAEWKILQKVARNRNGDYAEFHDTTLIPLTAVIVYASEQQE